MSKKKPAAAPEAAPTAPAAAPAAKEAVKVGTAVTYHCPNTNRHLGGEELQRAQAKAAQRGGKFTNPAKGSFVDRAGHVISAPNKKGQYVVRLFDTMEEQTAAEGKGAGCFSVS